MHQRIYELGGKNSQSKWDISEKQINRSSVPPVHLLPRYSNISKTLIRESELAGIHSPLTRQLARGISHYAPKFLRSNKTLVCETVNDTTTKTLTQKYPPNPTSIDR